jgi:membrane associated rhomboid family serine protease
MIPISDDNRMRRTFPAITYGLIALNFLFFFVELGASNAFIVRWAFVPSRFLANPTGQALTIFTAMFMHAGWLHILSNMLYLWIFGDNVEDYLGHANFLFFYLICGVVATFAQLAFNLGSDVPNLGASGAIAGVLGAYLLLFPRGRVNVLMGFFVIPLPALVVIGLWFILQLCSEFGSVSVAAQGGGIAYMAHVGGFITGLVIAFASRILSGARYQD